MEKCDKLVNETSAAVCWVKSLGRFVLMQINTQHEMSKFSSKCEYFIYLK